MTTLRKVFSVIKEPIQNIAISDHSEWGDHAMERWSDLGVLPYFGLFSDVPDSVLDMEYSNNFGAPESPQFVIWTENFVYFGTEYDGSTGIEGVPRNPIVFNAIKELE